MLYWHEVALLYIVNYLVTVGGVDPSKEACLASDNTYRGTACGCVVFQSYGLSHGHFYSPNYPNSYQSNFNCILYTFIGDVNEIVEIKFLNMDLEQHKGAQYSARGNECKDYIRIYSNTDRGEVNEDSRYDEEICGSLASMEEKKFYSSGRALVLEFHIGANSSERHTGFKGVYSFLEKSTFKTDGLLVYGTQCSYNMQSANNHTQGNFYSPRYPQKYPRSSHCQFMFMGRETETVKVTFNLIRLPKPNVHCGDYIKVYDGSNSSGKPLKHFCDHTYNNEEVFSMGPYLYIEFKSDDDREKQGFSAEYSFLDNRWKQNNPSPTSNDGSSEHVTGSIIIISYIDKGHHRGAYIWMFFVGVVSLISVF